MAVEATRGSSCGCGSSCCTDGEGADDCCGDDFCASDASSDFGEALYTDEQRKELPADAVLASLGCGNPTAVADIHEGETVLDLGSGGGSDVILSVRRVGPTGHAYGLDMTTRCSTSPAGTPPRRRSRTSPSSRG